MNLVYIALASTLVAAAVSWYQEDDAKLLGAWSDDNVRVAVYEEAGKQRWPHRLVVEKDDGSMIRKWGRWEDGVFYGPAIGSMPNSLSGEAELVSVDRPRGMLTCRNLVAHGVRTDHLLNYEMNTWR